MACLLIVKPDDALWERLGLFSFPFTVERIPAVPSRIESEHVLFVRHTLFAYSPRLLEGWRFIAYGPARALELAFSRGAMDYLRDPWECFELRARAGRLLASEPRRFGPFSFDGFVLKGPGGAVSLGAREAAFLGAILESPTMSVARSALVRGLWRNLTPESRAPDILAHRLRSRLASVAGPDPVPALRSLRGYGYRLDVY